MRVAIPTKNNRIDPQYSRAAEFTIYEIEIELVKKKEVVPLGKTAIADFLSRILTPLSVATSVPLPVIFSAQSGLS